MWGKIGLDEDLVQKKVCLKVLAAQTNDNTE
jgi:hypothetical protein